MCENNDHLFGHGNLFDTRVLVLKIKVSWENCNDLLTEAKLFSFEIVTRFENFSFFGDIIFFQRHFLNSYSFVKKKKKTKSKGLKKYSGESKGSVPANVRSRGTLTCPLSY